MNEGLRPSRALFALAMVGLGVLGLRYGDSAELWAALPATLPGRGIVIDACAVIEIATGTGLLLGRFTTAACRALLALLLLWLALLKLPPLLRAPQVAGNWESFAEVAVMLAGALCLYAAHPGAWERRHLGNANAGAWIRAGRLALIAALPMIGVSHFAYAKLTASLVPGWLGFPIGWAYLTGAASMAAAAGMLLGVLPRLAAGLEAAMLGIFTLLVWVPRLAATPGDQSVSSEFALSLAITAGAWLVADTYRHVPWLSSGAAARALPSE